MSGHAHTPKTALHSGNPVLRAVGWISQLCGVISACMIVIAVGITCQMIFLRYVLNVSTVWQTEAVTYMMVTATMLGLPYVQYLRGHVNVDLLPLMLPPGPRKVLAVITFAMVLAVVGAMLWYGFEFWHEAWDWGETSNSPWNPPLWIPYLALPVGFGLYFLQLAADLYALLVTIDKPFNLDEKVTVTEAMAARVEGES
jgi:TRAP-type C4-dicarboxylate transport system permease small subunit